MNRRLQPALLALVFATGFASLMYEVLWVRMFSLVFGATVFATSTVLTAFFAGLAIGSLIFGKLVDRFERPLLLYGLAEAGIGAYSAAFPSILLFLQESFVGLVREFEHSFYALSLVRFAACFLLLLLPTTLMGATLPVLGRLMVEARKRVGKGIGYIYATNTVGASLGCAVTGLLLIEAWGVSRTHWLAVGLNLAVATVALVLHWRGAAAPLSAHARAGTKATGTPSEAASPKRRRFWRKRARPAVTPPKSAFVPYPRPVAMVCLGVFGVSGAAALGNEVLWTRVLGVTLQSTTYSLTLILTTFLCGLGLGSYFFGKHFDSLQRPVLGLGAIQIAIGLYCLALVHLFGFVPDLAARLIEPSESAWGSLIALQFLLCFALMLFPTLLMGAAHPLVTRICTSRVERLGETVGKVNAASSGGAIAGAFVVGFMVIPSLGVKNGMMVVAATSVIGGIAALACSTESSVGRRRIGILATVAMAAVGVWTAQRTDLIVGVGSSAGQRRILYYEDGLVANVRVEQTSDNVVLLIDDKVQAGVRGARSSQGLGHIPMLLHPDPRHVLTIGLGAGMTAGAASRHPVESLRIVDLVESLTRSAPFFSRQNYDVLDNPSAKFIVGDGRNYLLTTDERFDVIISDIFFPAGAGTGSLYALEHYELASSRLREDGAMVQWLPIYQLSEAEFKIVAATFQEAFPYVELWLGDPDLMYPVVGLVGRNSVQSIDLAGLNERMARTEVSQGLAYGDGPTSLLAAFLMKGDEIESYAGAAPLNTDDRPRIEFSAPRNDYANRRLGWETMQQLAVLKTSVAPLLDTTGLGEAERRSAVAEVEAAEAARSHFYRGTFALGSGRAEEGYQAYREARSLAPDDEFLDFQTSESIGRLQIELGNLQQAAALLEAAVALRPDEIDPRIRLADLYIEESLPGRAESHLAEVARMYPDHVGALNRLGEIYVGQERWHEAAAVLERAIGILPVATPRVIRLHKRALRHVQPAPPP